MYLLTTLDQANQLIKISWFVQSWKFLPLPGLPRASTSKYSSLA
jgi:hypothetical protein